MFESLARRTVIHIFLTHHNVLNLIDIESNGAVTTPSASMRNLSEMPKEYSILRIGSVEYQARTRLYGKAAYSS